METPADLNEIRLVVERAFGQLDEAVLVDALRDTGNLFASSVALVSGEIVGHAALSPAQIGGASIFALAPVAVRPDAQRRGIGAAVVRHVLESAGDSTVTVLGDPSYYSRFGFVDAAPFGMVDAFSDAPGAFQVLRPQVGLDGTIEYARPFYDL